ncbi:DUF4440 domain-containing protein [Stagnihabitans tardus]|uniref:DUF4440 domain-containing protein n=1 Tax=Stagnihabitans tardus TaxID=2699202 RepID=A0AAE5BVB5_9RHOB|nr:nuclear transport factor 2 family protein [Stagnihabitans tardus]NBZ87634.1 DUF4440 domain-containing protein [Stagnihabitans tardus]
MTRDLPLLEWQLWRAETRHDPALMEATLAADFFEFGRSGRRYTREELILAPSAARPFTAQLHDLEVKEMSDTIALVTYVSELTGPDGLEWANRASLWDRSSGRWQLRFHQGTPTMAKESP